MLSTGRLGDICLLLCGGLDEMGQPLHPRDTSGTFESLWVRFPLECLWEEMVGGVSSSHTTQGILVEGLLGPGLRVGVGEAMARL